LVAVDHPRAAEAIGGEREATGAFATAAGEHRASSCITGEARFARTCRAGAANNDVQSVPGAVARVTRSAAGGTACNGEGDTYRSDAAGRCEDTRAARRTVRESIAQAHSRQALVWTRQVRDSRAGQPYRGPRGSCGERRGKAGAVYTASGGRAADATQDAAECSGNGFGWKSSDARHN
jgi:hypothetical protein